MDTFPGPDLRAAHRLLTGCAPASSGSASTENTLQETGGTVTTGDTTTVTFTDTAVTAAPAAGLEIDGTALTIGKAGTYLLTGQCADGSVKVRKGTTGATLVLSGLELTSTTTAPIVCGKSSQVTIVVADGTENTLEDTENNSEDSGSVDAENAVIKCKDGSQVTLQGGGTLNILAKGKNGIKSGATTQAEGEAALTLRELTLNIEAPNNDAINAEAALNIESGDLTLSAGDDALHCDYTLTIGSENTQGPTVNVTASNEALEGATVNVLSGNLNITSTDDCINAANVDLTDGSYAINISGGTVTAYSSTGDGFDSNGSLTISGGTVAVWTANGADNEPLDADGTVTISGGTVLAAGGSRGMGMNLTAQQSCLIFGGDTAQGGGQPQGMPEDTEGQTSSEPPEKPGDSTDPSAPSQAPGAPDRLEGGQAPQPSGTSGEAAPPEQIGQQPALDQPQAMGGPGGGATLLTEGSSFSIVDAQGNTLYSGTAPVTSLTCSSPHRVSPMALPPPCPPVTRKPPPRSSPAPCPPAEAAWVPPAAAASPSRNLKKSPRREPPINKKSPAETGLPEQPKAHAFESAGLTVWGIYALGVPSGLNRGRGSR